MTEKEIGQLLVTIQSVFPGYEPSKMAVEVWHEVIGHMDYEVAKKALIECLQQSEYMPRPADLVKRSKIRIEKVELSKEEREYLEQLHRKQRERNTTA